MPEYNGHFAHLCLNVRDYFRFPLTVVMKTKQVKIVLISATCEDNEFGSGMLNAIFIMCVMSKKR